MKRSAAVICIFTSLCISMTSCGSKSDTDRENPSVTSQTVTVRTSSEPVTSPVTKAPVLSSAPVISSASDTDPFFEDIKDAAETAIDDAKDLVTDIIEQIS